MPHPLKQEYKQLLKPSKRNLFFFFLCCFQKTQSLCLHCSRKNCQHLKEIINSASIAKCQPTPYPQLPAFTFRIAQVFQFVKPLTKGGYGQLFLVKHLPSGGQLMVAKVFSFAEVFVRGPEVLHSYLQEREVLLRCQHPNIIKLYYSFRSEYFIYQVMEFASGGDLSTALPGLMGNFEEIKAVLAQLVAALQALHSQGIFHGDLKLENVLLSPEQGQIKLADFGLSCPEAKASYGTPDYLAPEQLTGGQKSLASECWSLGVCAWELAAGMPPFYADDPDCILKAIAGVKGWQGDLEERAPGPDGFKSLLRGLLQPDPSKRLSITEVMKHQFFAGVNWKRLPRLQIINQNPFTARNERFSSFKPYNLKVLETERLIDAQEHWREGNGNGMFPSEEAFQEASQLFPLCNLYALSDG